MCLVHSGFDMRANLLIGGSESPTISVVDNGNIVQRKGAVHDKYIAKGMADVASNIAVNNSLYLWFCQLPGCLYCLYARVGVGGCGW